MQKIRRIVNRSSIVIVAGVLTFAFVLPFLFVSSGPVYAAGELEPREITMTTSAPGAAATYTVSFTTATAGVIEGVVVDFCANDPIPGDSCTVGPSSSCASGSTTLDCFSLGGTTPTIGTTSGLQSGTWVAASQASAPFTTLYYSCSSGNCTSNSVSAGQAIVIPITSVTNPTPNAYPGSFYARIFTYVAHGGATGYTSANPSAGGTVTDQGGDALSTAQTITVTAKVFETLTFCVFSSSCGTTPTATLGETTSGVLTTANTYGSSNVSYTLATNALNGVNVTMTGTTLCSASTVSYANCEGAGTPPTIAAIGYTASTLSTPGTVAQFGMCVYPITGVTAASTYASSSSACPNGGSALVQGTGYTPGVGLLNNTKYGFNDLNTGTCDTSGSSGAGTNASCGSLVMSSTGPVTSNTGNLTFVANITSTTPAGIYNSYLNMVASATF